jgi:hypothetical protein
MAEYDQGGHGADDSPYSNSHGGRPKSWLAVVVMMIGFLVSGVAMCIGPSWTMFWVGAGVIVVGGILALVADIWNDVVVDPPRLMPEEPHHSALGRTADDELRQRDLSGRSLAASTED